MEVGQQQYGGQNNFTELDLNEVTSAAINTSFNGNMTGEYPSLSYHPITLFIEQYAIPVISLVGLISNTLAFVVFLQKPLRNSSCSVFLAARSFSDNGFLSTLLMIWISRTFRLQLGSLSGSCNLIIFLSYFCGFISVWSVVFVTMENYIRICKPFVVNRFCTTYVAKIIVGILCLLSLGFYNFAFWAMNGESCVPFHEYQNTVQAFIYIDSLITLVLPLILISYLMTAIVCDLIKSFSIRSRKRTTPSKRTENPLAKVTKMLFAVTVTFFCFNLPSHIYRLSVMISAFMAESDEQQAFSPQEGAFHQITLLMSYVSLSINIIVYVMFGSKFRKTLIQTCRLSPKIHKPFIKVNTEACTNNNANNNLAISLSTILASSENPTSETVPLRENKFPFNV